MNLEEFFSAKMAEKKKPFSMTDYEAIPVEQRQEYVRKTYAPMPAKTDEAQIDIEGELKKKAPVTPKLEAIRKAVAPQPEQPAMPQDIHAQPAPQAAPELKQEEVQREPSSSGFDIPQELLLGLIPLATEALIGKGQGQSYDISSKYYSDVAADKLKRGRELEDQLAKLAAKKSETKNQNRFQAVRVVDPETKEVLFANYDKASGGFYDVNGKPLNADKIRAGYSVISEEYDRRSDVSKKKAMEIGEAFGRGTRLDPRTGDLVRIKDGQIIPVQGKEQTKLNPKQEKDLTKLVDSYKSTDTYKNIAKNLSAIGNVDALIREATDKKNATAYNLARGQIARIAGEVGTMNEGDIQRTGGDRSIKSQARRFANLQKTGLELTEKDIAELKEVIRIYKAVSEFKVNDAISGLEKDFVENYGGVPGAVTTKMQSLFPSFPKEQKSMFPRQVRKGSQVATVSSEEEYQEAMSEGWQ